MLVVTTTAQMQQLNDECSKTNRTVGAVFTMGALHAGHGELIKSCRTEIGAGGLLAVSIFVNPTQFNDAKDLEKYPRNLEADLAFCEAAGVDVVFAPSVQEMYPEEIQKFSAHALGEVLEGASRPGHFDAVATVVHRLLEITKPAVTCFGEKDFQQVAVVRQMIREANLPVQLVVVPTVREADGLAKSSRNQRLNTAARVDAVQLYAALQATANSLKAGERIESAIAAGKAQLQAADWKLDYLTVTDEQLNTIATDQTIANSARILIAATLGEVRLIDNLQVVCA